MVKPPSKNKILLVSKSPRRRILLEQAGYHFETLSLEVSEIIEENLNPVDQVRRIAQQKMQAFVESSKSSEYLDFLALTADTMVIFDGKCIGKGQSLDELKEWLLSYSGQSQDVVTACALLNVFDQTLEIWAEVTKVKFKRFQLSEVELYLKKNPGALDKAGGYGIQDPYSDLLIEGIDGSYTNVVGLPMESLAKKILEVGGM